ncbi:flagellar assembly peptidoglycan hydrolase FlgJ [Vagococcus sp. WN89Y]|uniref:flagellar assembly peptidoglycan hydrolase FlgJ n=1 Tax=Vagococcus sp. WN89Y TaxID=3457258 RepID=UPI003FCC80BD
MNSAALYRGGRSAAFDTRSLDKLKLDVKSGDSEESIKAAAKQMEGLFVQMMLKSMREASFKGGIFDNQQSEMFTSMSDQQLAQNIADNGKMGFADLMVSQMLGKKTSATDNVTATQEIPLEISPASHKKPVQFAGVPMRLPEEMVRQTEDETARKVEETRAKASPVHELTEAAAGRGGGFISRILAPAIEVSRDSGIPHQLIVAQAALESGWGKREIQTSDGKPSHNLFGVKATANWDGETTEITTTEYKNGVKQKVKAVFKVYSSYSEALSDYTSLISNSPRYKNVRNTGSAEQSAKALQSAGYATDPAYAKKLISIIHQVKSNVSQAANAYSSDSSSLF